MPRLPKQATPLRIFRKELGHSQKSFAELLRELVGMAPATYKSYELGQRRLRTAAAIELMIKFGVDPDSIVEKTGKPKDLAGRIYTKDSQVKWPGERVYQARATTRVIERINDRLYPMLLAARRAGKFTLALRMVDQCIADMQDSLSLHEHFRAVTDSAEPLKPWTPVQIYIADGFRKVPEIIEYPLSDAQTKKLTELMLRKKVCTTVEQEGEEYERYIRKDELFFRKAAKSKRKRL